MVGGKVHLGLQLRKEYIIFVVRDTGIGIAPLDVPHLFEKFYRIGKKDPSQTTGTSLGLAIVKSIAEHHHGSVMVESQLGKGSTFYLEIPYQQQKNSRGNLS
jgi:signal transduction histidine kinase